MPSPKTYPSPPVPPHSLPAPLSPLPAIRSFFQQQGKFVLTLAGYSGAGYEDPVRLRKRVTRMLDLHDPSRTLVNIGVTADGIGRAYRWAKSRGFTTTGIVSSAALSSNALLSPHCDHPFFVEDSTWGGYQGNSLSPTSEAIVAVSDLIIAAGGGEVTRDELLEMGRRGKPYRFISADMNHDIARAKASAKGLPPPSPRDLRGAAHLRFGNS